MEKKKPWEKPGSVGGPVLDSGQDIIVYSLFTYCFNKNFKCINVLYFYFYIVAISNNNSIM